MAKKEELIPLPIPDFPNVENVPVEQARALIEQFIKDFEEVNQENTKRFDKAIKRIRWCAFLRGFSDPFALDPVGLRHHYSWCPAKEWHNYVKADKDKSIFETGFKS